MNCYLKHLKTVCHHKAIVFRECKACGIAWQGITHDLSKFSVSEFIPSAKHFQGNRSPIEAEKEENGYSLAWLHHKGHNPHHWEYWTDFDSEGNVVANPMPYKYVVEMICDWIGAGIAYNSDKWTQEEPLEYYERVRSGRHFHSATEVLIAYFLVVIANDGLEQFHRVAKLPYAKEYYERMCNG